MLKNSQQRSIYAQCTLETEETLIPNQRDQAKPASEDQERAVAFGEALRAIWLYVGEDLVSPPSPKVFAVFELAHRHLRSALDRFTPQDFTLYAMSLLLKELEDADQANRLRQGAIQYLQESSRHLSVHLQDLVPNPNGTSAMSRLKSDVERSQPAASSSINSMLAEAPFDPQTTQSSKGQIRSEQPIKASIFFDNKDGFQKAGNKERTGAGLSVMVILFAVIFAAISVAN